MHRVITIDLSGQTRPFRIHEDAYEDLRRYLDRARARLGPDAEEVLDDLERSIAERLADIAGPDDRILRATDVAGVLEEVGAVDEATGARLTREDQVTHGFTPRRRKLYRIREGQDIAGVCTGLAAYSDLKLDVVRTVFVLLALATAGLFALVYLVLMFVLPVAATREEWLALMAAEEPLRT